MKKDEGLIQYVLAIMIVLIAALLIVYEISMRKITVQKQEIEDGLTSSALASAIIDLNEYGTYKYIRSNNGRGTGNLAASENKWGSAEDNLLNIFKSNLATNLKLNPTTLEPNNDSIISSPVTIKNFWIYNHELVESKDDSGNPIMIKDYLERWVRQHEESEDFIIYQYTATDDGGYNKTVVDAVKEADGKVYTPWDKNVIGGDDEALDGAGKGHVEVDTMTIYATIEFYVNPFGHGMVDEDGNNRWGIYDGAKFDWTADSNSESASIDVVTPSTLSPVKPVKITKSVVVNVKSVIEEAETHD